MKSYYVCDVFDRLLSRSDGFVDYTVFIYAEGINPVMEFGSGPRKLYLWSDAVDDLLAAETIAFSGTPGNILWPLTDHQGTIREIVDRNDSTGITQLVGIHNYNAYGKRVQGFTSLISFGYNKIFHATILSHSPRAVHRPARRAPISRVVASPKEPFVL